MIVGRDTFRHLLARARTFCFDRDIKPLRAMGLIWDVKAPKLKEAVKLKPAKVPLETFSAATSGDD